MDRESGFYWVKFDGEREVAEYYADNHMWQVIGCEMGHHISNEDVGERIEPPKESK
jgi:hypothetical protein